MSSKRPPSTTTSPAAGPSPIELLMRLPLRKERVWEGGPGRLPIWIKEPGMERPVRPWFGAWVCGQPRFAFTNQGSDNENWTPDLILDAFLEFALDKRKAGYRPGRLDVGEPAIADHLSRALANTGIEVRLTDQLDALGSFLSELDAHFRKEDPRPGSLDAHGVTVERMRSFAAAAKSYFEAAPWERLHSDEDLIVIESPKPPRGLGLCTVLGSAGLEYGLGFFSSRKAFETDAILEVDEEGLPVHAAWSLTYENLAELPMRDADLWEKEDFPVASWNAYPLVACVGPGRTVQRPNAAVLGFLEALLLTIIEATEDELDSGRWTKTVRTFGGDVTITLALPDLLKERSGRQLGLSLDRRAMERMMAEVHRFASGGEFDSIDDLNTAVQKRFIGRPMDEIPSTAATPAEKAQDLCYQAYDARGRLRMRLARQALAIDPDCAEAFVILAERAAEPARARDLYAKGVEAGGRAIAKLADGGDPAGIPYWGDLQTRPYMRAKFGLADSLDELGDKEGAVEQFNDLLRLNPNDNQGVRYEVLPLLIGLGRDEAARVLLDAYEDDAAALWPYARALLAYRESGDTLEARHHLVKAIASNPHLWKMIVAPEKITGGVPDTYAFGDRDEAVVYTAYLLPVWKDTPGALEWLKEAARKIAGRMPPPGRGRPISGGPKRKKKGGHKRR